MKIQIKEAISFEDFSKVYAVFGEPPYNENWDVEELTTEYNSLLQLGHISGYYIDDECIGMVTFRKMIPNQHPVNYAPDKKVMYISDLAVLSQYRDRGIGTELMNHALRVSKQEGYDIAYMRTLVKGKSMSYGLAVRCGLVQKENVFQLVSQQRNLEDRDEVDKRIFLDIDLKTLA